MEEFVLDTNTLPEPLMRLIPTEKVLVREKDGVVTLTPLKMNELWVATKAILLHNRRVLLLKRSGYCGVGEDDWELPGGGLRFGEDLLEGLGREILEETALTVRVDKLLYAMTARVNPTRQIVGLTYLAHTDSDAVTLSHEHKEYVWAVRDQVIAMLNKPMLDDLMKNSVLDALDID